MTVGVSALTHFFNGNAIGDWNIVINQPFIHLRGGRARHLITLPRSKS